MLREDTAAVAALCGEVASLAAHFDGADPPTARFLRVVLALLERREPPRAELAVLRRDYAASFERMFALSEDAGWAVRAGGAA